MADESDQAGRDHRDVIADFLDEPEHRADAPTEPGAEPETETEPGNEPGEPEQQPAAPGSRPRLPQADPARGPLAWLATRPTPGGIALILAAILFFIFAVVPMGPNGETRLFLMFKALTGGATIPPDSTAAQTEQAMMESQANAWQGFWTGVEVITDTIA
jgi:hypothetical protein